MNRADRLARVAARELLAHLLDLAPLTRGSSVEWRV
jgi:hypothetical protein